MPEATRKKKFKRTNCYASPLFADTDSTDLSICEIVTALTDFCPQIIP